MEAKVHLFSELQHDFEVGSILFPKGWHCEREMTMLKGGTRITCSAVIKSKHAAEVASAGSHSGLQRRPLIQSLRPDRCSTVSEGASDPEEVGRCL